MGMRNVFQIKRTHVFMGWCIGWYPSNTNFCSKIAVLCPPMSWCTLCFHRDKVRRYNQWKGTLYLHQSWKIVNCPHESCESPWRGALNVSQLERTTLCVSIISMDRDLGQVVTTRRPEWREIFGHLWPHKSTLLGGLRTSLSTPGRMYYEHVNVSIF